MMMKCLNQILFLQITLLLIIKLHYTHPTSVVLFECVVIYIADYYHD